MPTPNNALRVGGRLILDPTAHPSPDWTGTTANFGGTDLGIISAARARPNIRTWAVPAAERPGAQQGLYLGEEWHLSVVLKERTDAVMALAFANVVTPSSGSAKVAVDDSVGSRKPGMPLPVHQLLFVPHDRDLDALWFYACQPALEEQADLNMGSTTSRGFTTLWRAYPSAAGGPTYALGSLANLVLL